MIEALNPNCFVAYQKEKIRVFEANKRLYAHIVGEVKVEELEYFTNCLTKEELEKRKQLLLYAIEETQKHWQSIPAIKDRIHYFPFIEQLKETILEENEKEEKTEQLVKKIEQIRNGNY